MAGVPGRNDPCHCGSGKKYKRCHLDADRAAARAVGAQLDVAEVLAQIETAPEVLRRDFGVYINYVAPVAWQGNRCYVLGHRLYQRPPRETFHEFLIFVLRSTLGEEWRAEQAELPIEERHFILRASDEYTRW